MSKSLGNVFNLRDIYKVFPPRVVRFFLLSQHYRSPVDYSEEALKEAQRALFRIDNCYGIMMDVDVDFSSVLPEEEAMGEFRHAMNDDFNTAAALAIVYKIAEEFFKNYRKPKALEALKPKLAALKEICSILGVELINPIHELTDPDQSIDLSDYSGISDRIIQEDKLTEEVLQTLGHCRKLARKNKDWALADRIRDYLKERDITIMDRPGRSSCLVYYPEEMGEGGIS